MKGKIKTLIFCILIPLAVGSLASFITKGEMEAFASVDKPPLSPPGWLFPVVWTVLYILMGVASYFVITEGEDQNQVKLALTFYGVQLFFNFFWNIIFFIFDAYYLAFGWILLLLILIIVTTSMFFKISKKAGWLMIPYIIWVAFAAYLNLGIALLN